MPRVKLKERSQYRFRYQTTLKIRDINYGNHLSNDAVAGLIHDARIDMLHQLGCSEMELGDQQTGIIIGDLVINYKNQGFLRDKINIDLDIDEIAKKGFRVFYKISRGTELIALVETGVVTFNYQRNCPVRVPDVFLQKLEI